MQNYPTVFSNYLKLSVVFRAMCCQKRELGRKQLIIQFSSQVAFRQRETRVITSKVTSFSRQTTRLHSSGC